MRVNKNILLNTFGTRIIKSQIKNNCYNALYVNMIYTSTVLYPCVSI